MKVSDKILKIDGFKREFKFTSQFYRGDLANGENLYNYLKRLYRFTKDQEKALIFNRFTLSDTKP